MLASLVRDGIKVPDAMQPVRPLDEPPGAAAAGEEWWYADQYTAYLIINQMMAGRVAIVLEAVLEAEIETRCWMG